MGKQDLRGPVTFRRELGELRQGGFVVIVKPEFQRHLKPRVV